MSIQIPQSAAEVENRSKADVQNELPESNPFLKNSWLLALVASSANRIFDFYLQLVGAVRDNFPDTALGAELDRWLAIFGKTRLSATKANGNVVATSATVGGIIPLGTTLTISTGNYTSTSSATISAQTISVITIKQLNLTATVTTVSDHNLASGVMVTITGASPDEYNITAAIIVTGLNTFTYQFIGSVADATGTIKANFTSASVPVEADDFGVAGNLTAGTQLKLQSPLANVDDTLTVDFGDIGGGADQEGTESARARMLFKIQNPVAHFNSSDIIDKAKEVAGVTRVFVQEAGTVIGEVLVGITRVGTGDVVNVASVTLPMSQDFQTGQDITIAGATPTNYNVMNAPILVESDTVLHYIVAGTPTSPATGTITATISVPIGQVRIFFMRDNDISPIPTGTEVTKVRAKLEEIVPANTDKDNDLLILAPTEVLVDFTFTELKPDTTTMQTAIKANLKQFFAENTDVGVIINVNAYSCAIFNTVDTETGDIVKSFTLGTPMDDIPIASNSIGTLGDVTFV